MNRKAKNIIFWTVAIILIIIFVAGFVFGVIKNVYGAGTNLYSGASSMLKNIGINSSDFFKWSTYLCVAAGAVLTFMFYKKFNTRIN